jgi:mono/diheme cytochrome c family protein
MATPSRVLAAAATPAPTGRKAAVSTPAPTAPLAVVPDQAPDATSGQSIYAEHCAECHGSVGRGDGARRSELPGPPASFADGASVGRTTPARAFEVVSDGRMSRLMPAWRDTLSAQERWDAVYGAWSFYYTPDRLARGRAVWRARCAACHGDGEATAVVTGPLAVAWPRDGLLDVSQDDLLTRTLAAGVPHDGVRGQATETLRSALDYARALTFKALPFEGLTTGGTVRGRIRVGTATGGDVTAARLELIPFASGVPGESATAPVMPSGAYTVADLVIGADIAYRLVVRYDGADYIGDTDITLSPAGPEHDGADMVVYASGTDVPLVVDTAHIVVAPQPAQGVARVSEVWVVANDTDRTRIAGDDGATLRFALPVNALDVGLDDARLQASAAMEGGVLATAASLPPGRHTAVVSYAVPYIGTALDLVRRTDLEAREVRVLVASPGARIESAALGKPETVEIQGQSVEQASATAVPADTELRVHIGGLPPASRAGAPPGAFVPRAPSPIDRSVLDVLAAALLVIGVAVPLAYPLLARSRAGQEDDT